MDGSGPRADDFARASRPLNSMLLVLRRGRLAIIAGILSDALPRGWSDTVHIAGTGGVKKSSLEDFSRCEEGCGSHHQRARLWLQGSPHLDVGRNIRKYFAEKTITFDNAINTIKTLRDIGLRYLAAEGGVNATALNAWWAAGGSLLPDGTDPGQPTF
ncbi:MAG: hypothetical protein FJX76_14105 [Armatimonadetes bacterium]|nr:hypothetical protein [Armatimonadota bacterium]